MLRATRGLRIACICASLAAPLAADPAGQIAFVRGVGPERAVHVMNPDGSGATRLAAGQSPAWSPDGERLVFEHGGALHVMRRDGSGVQALTDGAAHDSWPSFSPDGGRLLFLRRLGVELQVHVMEATAGATPQRVPLFAPDLEDPGFAERPVWSPDGRSLAFSMGRRSQIGSGHHADIFVAHLDGSGLRSLTAGLGLLNSAPTWSPDGSRIAFYSRRDEGEGIFLIDADGSNLRLLSPSWAIDWDPTWSPDGEWLAFVSTQGRQSQDIHIMRADGSQVRNLTLDNLSPDLEPAWSPVALPPLPTAVIPAAWATVKTGRR